MPRNLFLTDEDEANRIRNTPEYKRLASLNPMRTTQDQVSEYAVKNANTVSRKRSESAARKQKEVESRTPRRGMGDSPAEFSAIPNSKSELPSLSSAMGSPSTEDPSNYFQGKTAADNQRAYNSEIQALQSEWDADPIAMQSKWLNPEYILSGAEKSFAEDRLKEIESEIRDKNVQRAFGGYSFTDEDNDKSARMTALQNKLNWGSSAMAGILESVPGLGFLARKVTGAAQDASNEAGYTIPEETQIDNLLESSKNQNPLAYGAGYMGGKISQYSLTTPFLSGTKFAQAAGNALGGTKAAQALSKLPVLGHLATPQAISNIVGDTTVDLALDTFPSFMSDLYRYDSQQVDDTIPESEKMQISEVLQSAAGNVAGNVAFNAGGELLPSLFNAAKGLVRRTGGASASSVASGLSPQSVVPLDDFVGDARAAANAVVDQADTLPKAAVQETVTQAATPSTGADEIIRMYNSGEQLSRAQLDTLKPNGSNRAAFESATGVKLPDTSSATRSFFSDAKQSLTPSDVSSTARAQAATGKPMQSSVAQKVRTLYDDIDRGAVDADEITRRVREIAENMVDRKSYMVGNDDSIARIRKEYLKQRIYINDSDLSDILYSSGAKNLSEFNKQYGTRLTRDDSAIPLDTWVMDLYSHTGENAGFTAVDDFLETLDSAKSFVARQFDESGYKQAVDDAAMSILNGYAPREVTQQYGVGAMKSQFDRDPVPTLDMQNQASVKTRLKNNRIDDLSNLGKQEHELYSDRQALYDAQNILDAETAYTGDSDAAIRNIIADLSERQMWDKEQIKTSQLIRDKLIDKANSARKGTEEYKAAIRELDEWIEQIDKRISASGQALQAWNESIKLAARKDGRLAIGLVQRKINKMNKDGAKKFGAKWKDFVLSDAEKEAFKNATDDKAVQDALASLSKRIQKEYPVTMAEKVSELMRLFMLSGPASQARNIAGNIPMAGLGSVKRCIEGTAQSAYSKLTKGDFQQTAAVPSLSSRALARSVAKEKVPELLKAAPHNC